MILSMTAFGAARIENEHGTLSIEVRSINNRYLDLNLRLPDDLRFAENRIREQIGRYITRGKVEFRVGFTLARSALPQALDTEILTSIARQLEQARQFIPDTPAPPLASLLQGESEKNGLDPALWLPMCEQATDQALTELQNARQREGTRLAEAMIQTSGAVGKIVDQVDEALPDIVAEQQSRIAQRLREALMAASPEGFAQISGAELSARIAQETSLFGLRTDVAEELTRLRSHVGELVHILTGDTSGIKGSLGKRLDFLFQEMNREANTLGSKAAALTVTQAAIDLKLLIEQMREQAQNIE